MLLTGELAGTALGIIGAGTLASGAHSENKVRWCTSESCGSWTRDNADDDNMMCRSQPLVMLRRSWGRLRMVPRFPLAEACCCRQ